MAIFLAWQAGIAQKFEDPGYTNQGVGIAGLASIFLFSGAFSASFGPVSEEGSESGNYVILHTRLPI